MHPWGEVPHDTFIEDLISALADHTHIYKIVELLIVFVGNDISAFNVISLI